MSEEQNTEEIVAPETPAIDKVEEAAIRFTTLLPFVTKIGRSLNGNGVIRVLHAMAEFPLGKAKPRLLNDGEKQLFHILQELQGAKSTIVMDMIQKQQPAPELPVAETKETVNE